MKTLSDGAMFAFSSASAALNAARRIQEAMEQSGTEISDAIIAPQVLGCVALRLGWEGVNEKTLRLP